jgi:hypothetical protein
MGQRCSWPGGADPGVSSHTLLGPCPPFQISKLVCLPLRFTRAGPYCPPKAPESVRPLQEREEPLRQIGGRSRASGGVNHKGAPVVQR